MKDSIRRSLGIQSNNKSRIRAEPNTHHALIPQAVTQFVLINHQLKIQSQVPNARGGRHYMVPENRKQYHRRQDRTSREPFESSIQIIMAETNRERELKLKERQLEFEIISF